MNWPLQHRARITSLFIAASYFMMSLLFFIPTSTHAVADGCTQAPIGRGVFSTLWNAGWGNNPIANSVQTQEAIQATICQPVPRIKIPGLNFTSSQTLSENTYTDPTDGSVYLFIPFIGEYIAAVYRYGIALAGVVIVLILVVSGIQWTLGGANPDNIDAAKERMRNAIIGLGIITFTYSFLYIIDPNLTSFQSLKIKLIKGEFIPEPIENDDVYSGTSVPPTGNGSGRLCNSIETCRPFCSQPEETWPSLRTDSIALTQDTIRVPEIPGLSAQSNVRILPALVEPLRLAAQEAVTRGYKLRITSGHRPIEGQLRLACPRILDGTFNSGTTAWPGGSNHGRGIAVDIILQDSSGSNALSNCCDTGSQNMPAYRPYNKILAEIMYSAGWKRLKSEVWHFEYPNTPLESTRTVNCYETSC